MSINLFFKIQNVINQFTTLAKSERCRFIGNINVGKDVTTNDIIRFYNAVVMVSIGFEMAQLTYMCMLYIEGVAALILSYYVHCSSMA